MMRSTPRDPVFDLLRGFAMALVVLGHALIGVEAALGSERWARFLIILIYATHMPVFFLLAGYFAAPLMARPRRGFLKSLSTRIVWPYLLWSVLLLLVHHAASDVTNTRVEQFQPLTILWKPPAVMWFLYVLFLANLMARLLTLLGRPAMLCAAIGFLGLAYWVPFPWAQSRYVALFLFGLLLRDVGQTRINVRFGGTFSAVVFAGVVGVAWRDAAYPIYGYPAAHLSYLPAMLAGPVLLFVLASKVAATTRLGALRDGVLVLGRNSMPVFLLHIFVVAGTRVGLIEIGVTQPVVLVALATALGILVPLLVAHFARRWGLSVLFGFGSSDTAVLSAGKQAKDEEAALCRPATEQR